MAVHYIYDKGSDTNEKLQVYCDECGSKIWPFEDCWIIYDDEKSEDDRYYCLNCMEKDEDV